MCSYNYVYLRLLTQFSPIFHFYTPWKRQKTKGFLTFSGVIEIEYWAKMCKRDLSRFQFKFQTKHLKKWSICLKFRFKWHLVSELCQDLEQYYSFIVKSKFLLCLYTTWCWRKMNEPLFTIFFIARKVDNSFIILFFLKMLKKFFLMIS